MRSIIIALCLLLAGPAFGQRKPKIKGNREPVEVQENLDYFNRVEIDEDVPLALVAGNQPSYVIHADDNLIDVFRFQVVDSTLRVSSFYKVRSSRKLELTVVFPDLEFLRVTGSDVEIDRPKGESLMVELGENSKLEGTVGGAFVSVDATADARSELRIGADTLVSTLSDRAQQRFHIMQAQSVRLTMGGNSKADLSGETTGLSVAVSENANLGAKRLDAESTDVVARDRSRAEVRASSVLYLNSEGNAETEFYGEGKVTVEQFRGSSVLRKKED